MFYYWLGTGIQYNLIRSFYIFNRKRWMLICWCTSMSGKRPPMKNISRKNWKHNARRNEFSSSSRFSNSTNLDTLRNLWLNFTKKLIPFNCPLINSKRSITPNIHNIRTTSSMKLSSMSSRENASSQRRSIKVPWWSRTGIRPSETAGNCKKKISVTFSMVWIRRRGVINLQREP